MRRRTRWTDRPRLGSVIIALVATLIILTGVPPALAQAKIGILAWLDCEVPELMRGLEELGHRPGETIMIECATAGGTYPGLAPAANRLVDLGVDVIVGLSQPAGMAASEATETIPIVSIISGDPVAIGLAESLAEPGHNLTGLSYYANELTAKRIELLKEAVPKLSSIEVLANPVTSYLPFEDDARREAARIGLDVTVHHVETKPDLKAAFVRMAPEAQAVFVLPDMMLSYAAGEIADLALGQGLPVMAWGHWFTAAGCLMSYSARYDELIHRLAHYVNQILKGAAPGDLPIEQPTTFELSINLRTAAALGLELPSGLLLRADEVIE